MWYEVAHLRRDCGEKNQNSCHWHSQTRPKVPWKENQWFWDSAVCQKLLQECLLP